MYQAQEEGLQICFKRTLYDSADRCDQSQNGLLMRYTGQTYIRL